MMINELCPTLMSDLHPWRQRINIALIDQQFMFGTILPPKSKIMVFFEYEYKEDALRVLFSFEKKK